LRFLSSKGFVTMTGASVDNEKFMPSFALLHNIFIVFHLSHLHTRQKCTSTHTHEHTQTHTYTHTHARAQTRTHTHTHTHTHLRTHGRHCGEILVLVKK